MKSLRGLTAIVAIFMISFYVYSHFSGKSAALPPPQTAIVLNLANKESSSSNNKQVIPQHDSTTTKSKTPLEGFKETELQSGLDNIKAGLDLLTNPIE